MKNIQSVERAFDLLERLDGIGEEGIGVQELAAAAHLKTPTTHNFLQTLCALGYVEQTATGKYRITEKIRFLGWDGRRKNAILARLRLPAVKLAAELDETIVLTTRSGRLWQTLLLVLESRRELTVRQHDLPVNPNFYISATGRCILSQLDEAELKRQIATFRLPDAAEWPEALTFDAMRKALVEIRRLGFARLTTPGGVTGIAVPVGDDSAIGVMLPASRCDELLADRIVSALKTMETGAPFMSTKPLPERSL